MSSYNLNQFNSFLQKATDAITCNSECQRNRTIDSLKQKFINAQTNIASANNQLQVAEKNYVTFAEGQGEYNEILINFKNVVDLYFHYKKENIKLFKKLKQETNDVLTNERKSYYINQESDTLSYFYFYFLLIIYIIIFISYFLFSFIYPSNTSILKHILI